MPEQHLVFGLHAVEAVLAHEPTSISALWLEDTRHDKRIRLIHNLAKKAGVPIHRVAREELDRLTGELRHQGVAARTCETPARSEQALLPMLQGLEEPAFLLILDGVQDPHNLGACLRTADAVGVHAVIAPRDRACGLTGTVRKVASGAAEHVPFFQVTNLARTLRQLQDAGIWLVGTAVDAPATLYETDLAGNLALILGAEGSGMRRLTREHCDSLMRLPMQGCVESLNVSVSAGICLYEALRQRQKGV